MSRKKVILVGGHINCGKNQFAKYLKEAYTELNETSNVDEDVRLDLFAYSLKHWASMDFINLGGILNNIADEIMSQLPLKGCSHCVERVEPIVNKLRFGYDNWFEDKTDITRTLLQTYGTEIMRQRVKDNYWAEDTKARLKGDTRGGVVIITDFRFPNEAESIRDDDWDLYTIRLDRSVDTDKTIASHASETSLDEYTNWSYIVKNDGEATLEELKNMANMVAEDIMLNESRHIPWPVWVRVTGFGQK